MTSTVLPPMLPRDVRDMRNMRDKRDMRDMRDTSDTSHTSDTSDTGDVRHAREAMRQQALVAALHGAAWDASAVGFAEGGGRLEAGLRAYRLNLGATAARALGSTFATVRAALGADAFAALARRFHDAAPPSRGDLGEWGDGFADWLARQPETRDLPGLPDAARLDLAVHRCERAADAAVDLAALDALRHRDPSTLRLQLASGTAVLRSAHPVAAAHRLAHDAERRGAALEPSTQHAVLTALAGEGSGGSEGEGGGKGTGAGTGTECLRIVRAGWRAAVDTVDEPTFAWTGCLLDGLDLGAALECAGPSFDFAAWLAEALRGDWLQTVRADTD